MRARYLVGVVLLVSLVGLWLLVSPRFKEAEPLASVYGEENVIIEVDDSNRIEFLGFLTENAPRPSPNTSARLDAFKTILAAHYNEFGLANSADYLDLSVEREIFGESDPEAPGRSTADGKFLFPKEQTFIQFSRKSLRIPVLAAMRFGCRGTA